MNSLKIFVLLCCIAFLEGCVPLAVTAGVGTIAASSQERGLGGFISDTEIRTKINVKLFDKNPNLYQKISIEVNEGKVLLTGTVDNPKMQIEALRLIWQVKGVKEVINEMRIGNKQSIGAYLNDMWITAKVKSQLLINENIRSRNYSITTEEGIVYLMGIASSKKELDTALNIIRKVNGVVKVISYMRLRDQIEKTSKLSDEKLKKKSKTPCAKKYKSFN